MHAVIKLELWSMGLSFYSYINSNSYLYCQDQAFIVLITVYSQSNCCIKKTKTKTNYLNKQYRE